jgi:hypothetical protein
MKVIFTMRYYLLLVILLAVPAAALAQDGRTKYKNDGFCGEGWSDGDRISVRELREASFSAPGLLTVDAGTNGGISVRGENRPDVLVRACVQGWGNSEEEASSIVRSIRIETGSTVRADTSSRSDNWSVSYEILVPHSMNIDLKAHNGGIAISSVEGNLKFQTTNGGVSLNDLAGDVRGRTTNGGVVVRLTGAAWRGSGLDVETTNGGVKLSMPQNYAARVETGTVNGGFKSAFAALNLPEEPGENRWNRKKRVSADVNGGGAPIRVVTTNGGIIIDSVY